MMRRLAPLLLALLAACATTPTEWVRADTGAPQRDRDYQECRDIAWKQALDESSSSRPLYPPWTGTGFNTFGAPWREPQSPSYFSRGPREAEFTDYCMRGRGYRLQILVSPR
ncbi:MAG: hypothetical protein OJJ21_21825 [Ferrovibrio sp.]|uniref:hypothetical protein n=1 Tax=Ferrovibrio sp. TaxID=1917215 RepID=UPI0026334836|nr:hypothetical protein [Ferrovibrio sp.]MCW0236252.1 hypothetical protein [Ferrovibrio sp.]